MKQSHQLTEEEFWQQEVAKRLERQAVNKKYIDTYLADTIQRLAVAALNERPTDPPAFMRDVLLNIEHKPAETSYTSIKDLRKIREEVQSLRIRKQLLS
jgi:hypothetical protein